MSKLRITLRAPLALLMAGVLLSLTACGTPQAAPAGPAASLTSLAPTPIIGEPILSVPTPVHPGDKVGIAVPVSGPAGAEIKYEWTAPPDTILEGQGTSGITYQAPSEPGTYKIGLKITSAGVTLERSVFVTVEEKVVTPASPTQAPTREPDVTPAQPTPAPTPACISYRPPLENTGNFAGSAKIETPQDGATGLPPATSIRVAGTYVDKPPDATLWLLVFASNNLYFPQASEPQTGNPMPQAEGRWLVNAWLGAKGGPPECFDLVLIYGDAKLNEFFGNWLRNGAATGDFPGMSPAQLQDHKYRITEKAYITVQTPE